MFETSAGSVTGSSSFDLRQDNKAFRPVGSLLPPDAYRYPTSGSSPGLVTRTTLAQWEVDRSPTLSGGFSGKPVKGLLNINTAPIEVLSTLPHMTQLIYDDSGREKSRPDGGYLKNAPVTGPTPVGTDDTFDLSIAPSPGRAQNPTNLFPSSMEIYRDRLNSSHLLQGKKTQGDIQTISELDAYDDAKPFPYVPSCQARHLCFCYFLVHPLTRHRSALQVPLVGE